MSGTAAAPVPSITARPSTLGFGSQVNNADLTLDEPPFTARMTLPIRRGLALAGLTQDARAAFQRINRTRRPRCIPCADERWPERVSRLVIVPPDVDELNARASGTGSQVLGFSGSRVVGFSGCRVLNRPGGATAHVVAWLTRRKHTMQKRTLGKGG